MNKHWLIWDGECGFCYNAAVKIRKRDAGREFQIVTYQNCPSPPMHPALYEACKSALYVVTQEGQELRGANGVLFAMQETGLSWWWKLWRTPPFLWLSQAVYMLIARNRGLASKVFFRNSACGIDNRYPEIDN